MYSITINLNDKDEIRNINISKNKTISYSDLFDICGSLLGLVCVTILNGLAKTPNYTEEKSKQDRAALYDNLILLVSMLSETIYPEYKDLKGDPEDFLKFLDRKVDTLNKLEKKVDPVNTIIDSLDFLTDKQIHSLIREMNTCLANRKIERGKDKDV